MPKLFSLLRERFGLLGSFASLLRVHVWIIIGLVAVGTIRTAPEYNPASSWYNRQINDPLVREIGADINDDRGFHPTQQREDTFHIAWVGGSSLQARSDEEVPVRRFVPQRVREQIPDVGGFETVIDVYMLQALRTWDLYVATLAAIEQEPDHLVVTLNPIWLFNDQAVSSWPNLSPTAAEALIDDPQTWPLLFGLASPADVATGVVGDSFDGIEDRWGYGADLRAWLSDRTPLDRSVIPEADGEPTELQRIAGLSSPLAFWSSEKNERPPELAGTQIDAYNLERANPDRGSWNRTVVGWLADAIVDADIPTTIYLAPLRSDTLADPDADAALASIESQLATYVDDFDAAHVSFTPKSLSRELPWLPFRDLIHMWLPGADAVAEVVADRICTQLRELGEDPFCIPLPVEEAA
ncbi:MAG: hypothetical protein AAGC53_03505 [Actinomycetota bacterium]